MTSSEGLRNHDEHPAFHQYSGVRLRNYHRPRRLRLEFECDCQPVVLHGRELARARILTAGAAIRQHACARRNSGDAHAL